MKQLEPEYSEILKTFLNNKKIITNQYILVIFIVAIASNMTLMVIEIKPHQSNNTLMKLNHT